MADRDGILLIGGNGFFGQALAHALLEEGREVHVLSRHSTNVCVRGLSFHQGSQDDADIVIPLLKMVGTVIHLASTTTPGLSAGRSTVDAIENLLPAAHFLELMASYPPDRLIFVSTGGAIYGNPSRLPVDENHPPHPISGHAAGKLALEGFFRSFAHGVGVPLTILRPSNLYGPGQSLRGGFGLIRTLLDKIKNGTPFDCWGDGSIQRDSLYIDDAVRGTLSLLALPDAAGTFNLGSGEGKSINELIDCIRSVTGRDLKVRFLPARNIDVRAVYLDCTKIRNLTAWQPRVDLEEGVGRTWHWLMS